MVPVARYAALVVQTNPLGSADALLARPDVRAELAAALDSARQAAAAIVAAQWDISGAPDAPVRAYLLADIGRQYGDAARLHAAVRTAHASVPQRQFIRGVTTPGTSPAIEAGNERAAAVRDAILAFARQTALRSKLTVVTAAAAARTARTLAEAHARQDAGEHLLKRWEASMNGRDPRSCHWCRKLHGVTIGLHESFLPYLGGPADLTGHGHLTQPPKPYRGELQGPPLHPHCRCKIVIVREGEPKHSDDLETRPAETSGNSRSGASTNSSPRFITAAQVRAMPEPRYRALVAFLRAALHELGQVLRRLRGVSRA
jgi:hypothetical protein